MGSRLKQKSVTIGKKEKVRKKEEKPQILEKQKLDQIRSRDISSLSSSGMHGPTAQGAIEELVQMGISTLGDLEGLSEEDLKTIKFLKGEKTISFIKRYLHELGLSLANPEEQRKETLNAPIESLEISKRSLKALKNAGVDYVYQLVQYSMMDILRLKFMGRKSLKEIKMALDGLNLSLDMDFSKLGLEKEKQVEFEYTGYDDWYSMSLDKLEGYARAFISERRIGNRQELEKANPSLYKVLNNRRDESGVAIIDKLRFRAIKKDRNAIADWQRVEHPPDNIAQQGFKSSRELFGDTDFSASETNGITMKLAFVLESEDSLETLREVVSNANAEMERIADIVKPEMTKHINAVLKLFRK